MGCFSSKKLKEQPPEQRQDKPWQHFLFINRAEERQQFVV
jgi:hypothetical protein